MNETMPRYGPLKPRPSTETPEERALRIERTLEFIRQIQDEDKDAVPDPEWDEIARRLDRHRPREGRDGAAADAGQRTAQ